MSQFPLSNMGMISAPVRVLNKSKFSLPEYKHQFDSGMDVQANNDSVIVIEPGHSSTIGTGLYFAIPPGLEFQVRSRSGLAHKVQVSVLNSPGTIDAPYRGELGIIVYNHGTQPFFVHPGDRIAQIVLAPVLCCEWQPVEDEFALDSTTRGEGGFGSTGVSAPAISSLVTRFDETDPSVLKDAETNPDNCATGADHEQQR